MAGREDEVGFAEGVLQQLSIDSPRLGIAVNITAPYGYNEWMKLRQCAQQSVAGGVMRMDDVGLELPDFFLYFFCSTLVFYTTAPRVSRMTRTTVCDRKKSPSLRNGRIFSMNVIC